MRSASPSSAIRRLSLCTSSRAATCRSRWFSSAAPNLATTRQEPPPPPSSFLDLFVPTTSRYSMPESDASWGSASSSTSRSSAHSPRLDLKIARCPQAKDDTLARYKCPHCSKEFAFDSALQRHVDRHTTHRHECTACRRRFKTSSELKRHFARHGQRTFFSCASCGDEFSTEARLSDHEERYGDSHSSLRESVQLTSVEEINERFRYPIPVNANSVVHTTDRGVAHEILRRSRFSGVRAFRAHDGVLRRDDAPPVVFFSAMDRVYSISPHPVFSEPGELCASISLPLEFFLENRNEYRLYFVACVSLARNSRRSEDAALRASLLLAPSSAWRWCEERNLVELDVFDNSILCARRDEDGTKSWEVASHVLLPELGLKRVSVAVAVAGESLDMRFSDHTMQLCDVSHVFQDEDGFHCPTCLECFPHSMRLYDHLSESEVYACPVEPCNASFSKRAHLSKHLRSHEGALANIHVCDWNSCDYTTSAKANLSRHMLSHSVECPSSCDECGRAFKSDAHLASHMRSHSDDRPFRCRVDPLCSKVFKYSASRLRHEKVVHMHASETVVGV